MGKYNEYTEMGLRAIKRAARKAYEDARKNNLKIPIWKNGKVVYIEPTLEIISELSKPEN
jgi:hypothetical protein